MEKLKTQAVVRTLISRDENRYRVSTCTRLDVGALVLMESTTVSKPVRGRPESVDTRWAYQGEDIAWWNSGMGMFLLNSDLLPRGNSYGERVERSAFREAFHALEQVVHIDGKFEISEFSDMPNPF